MALAIDHDGYEDIFSFEAKNGITFFAKKLIKIIYYFVHFFVRQFLR